MVVDCFWFDCFCLRRLLGLQEGDREPLEGESRDDGVLARDEDLMVPPVVLDVSAVGGLRGGHSVDDKQQVVVCCSNTSGGSFDSL